MVCPCCVSPELCCCSEDTVTVSTAEECDGTTSPIASPIVDLADITIVVDWDGLTATATNANSFAVTAFGSASFACARSDGANTFSATGRILNASFTLLNTGSGQCRSFSAQISGTFFELGGPISALSSTLTPYVGECKLIAPSDENDSSCTFVDYPTWCMGNPFSDTVTVEMIIAP